MFIYLSYINIGNKTDKKIKIYPLTLDWFVVQ